MFTMTIPTQRRVRRLPGQMDEILRLCARPRDRISDVVYLLSELQPLLEEVNQYAARFNLLYLGVTSRVEEFERAQAYRNPDFLRLLDLRFADRYVAALTGWVSGDPAVPSAWMMVFEPENDSLDPAQYAALGVNAHINVDLATALIATLDELHIDPVEGSPEHADFLLVNQVFHEMVPVLRRVFLGFQPEASLLDSLENWIVQVVIDESRSQAWDEAMRFWRKRCRPGYLRHREEKLDFTACLFGDAIASTACGLLLAGEECGAEGSFALGAPSGAPQPADPDMPR